MATPPPEAAGRAPELPGPERCCWRRCEGDLWGWESARRLEGEFPGERRGDSPPGGRRDSAAEPEDGDGPRESPTLFSAAAGSSSEAAMASATTKVLQRGSPAVLATLGVGAGSRAVVGLPMEAPSPSSELPSPVVATPRQRPDERARRRPGVERPRGEGERCRPENDINWFSERVTDNVCPATKKPRRPRSAASRLLWSIARACAWMALAARS
mmetsp:Transcript_51411/g.149325  ORF Transcript_51411/g.149325 Transcript_51411/m.149325 type:complete len:214 (+) Transcript_51411:588-1229(+)